jgi:hypothetical protein
MEQVSFVHELISIILIKKIGLLCGGLVFLAVGGILYAGGQERSQCQTNGSNVVCGNLSGAQLFVNVGLFLLIIGAILTIIGIVISYKGWVSLARGEKLQQNQLSIVDWLQFPSPYENPVIAPAEKILFCSNCGAIINEPTDICKVCGADPRGKHLSD